MTPLQNPQQLGLAIRKTRKHLRLTQAELALAAGVGIRFIVELEAGKPTIRLQTLMQVIEALGGQLGVSGLPGREQHG